MPDPERLQLNYWMNQKWHFDDIDLHYGFFELTARVDARAVTFTDTGIIFRGLLTSSPP